MRQQHHPLALAIVSLAITAASLPGTAYARKSLMEYGSRHASQAHGRHAVQFRSQSAGNSNSGAGPSLSTFPGQGHGPAYGFGQGHAHAWLRHGRKGAGGYRPGAAVNADYLLITMRNGVKLQGNLLAQLAWSSGFALQPVMADSAGNYVVSVRGRRNSSSNDPTTLLASIKTNPNVLDASQAFMGQTRQLTAAPGASVSVAASDLIGSVAATSYQWTQLSGTPVQLGQPTDSTLALTLPQTTTSGTVGAPGSGTTAATPSLSANRFRLRPAAFRPSLMQTARRHGHGDRYGNGHGRGQLAFELIARDSADRAYIGKVVIAVTPAAIATPGGTGSTTSGGTDPSGSTSGTTDTSGNTGLTDPTSGTPLASNPSTGAYIDPTTGQDMQTDPTTGLPIDPTTGQLIDPTTGLPISDAPSSGSTDPGASDGTVSTDPAINGSGGSAAGSGGGVIDGSISAA